MHDINPSSITLAPTSLWCHSDVVDISRYVQELQDQLSVAAAAAGDEATAIAERLASTLDSTARIILLEALSEAAAEITTELAPASVDVRLRGRDPEFVVTASEAPRFTDTSSQTDEPAESAPVPDGTEEVTTRTTLRLPESVKLRMEAAAARERLSVNSWLLRAITAALTTTPLAPQRTQFRNSGNRFTGWVR